MSNEIESAGSAPPLTSTEQSMNWFISEKAPMCEATNRVMHKNERVICNGGVHDSNTKELVNPN